VGRRDGGKEKRKRGRKGGREGGREERKGGCYLVMAISQHVLGITYNLYNISTTSKHVNFAFALYVYLFWLNVTEV